MKAHRDELSPKQSAIVRAIETAVRRDGRSPTIRELGAAVHIASTSHIEYLLRGLEERGYIIRDPGARGIRLAQPLGIPVLGRIAAGEPLALFEDGHREQLDFSAHTRAADAEGEYALLVRGDSMIEDYIFDGDYVLVHPAKEAENGAVVVALHHGATTGTGAAPIKRFHRDQRRRQVRLQPANKALEDIVISAAEWDREWQVQGIVTAIYRPYR